MSVLAALPVFTAHLKEHLGVNELIRGVALDAPEVHRRKIAECNFNNFLPARKIGIDLVEGCVGDGLQLLLGLKDSGL